MTEEEKFDQWAIVELFGRQVIAGRVTEQVIGGGAFIRVDVPEDGQRPAFTRFYGDKAIYALTPVSEAAARAAIRRFKPEPINVYIPELRQLAEGTAYTQGKIWQVGDDELENEELEGDDDDEEFNFMVGGQ